MELPVVMVVVAAEAEVAVVAAAAIRLFIRQQILEIRQSKTLSWYGFFLTLGHLASYALFTNGNTFGTNIFSSFPICWPFYLNCQSLRSVLETVFSSYMVLYLSLGIVSAILFVRQKINGAYIGLAIITAMKFLITVHDYRSMGNYHNIHYLAVIIFLFVPAKIKFLKTYLVICYIGSGILRINSDWMAGYAIYNDTGVSQKFTELGLAYVIILETCISFFLLNSKKRLFYFSFAQFVIFHLYSFKMFGYFSPVIMLFLLSVFVLERIYSKELEIIDLREALVFSGGLRAGLLILFVFSLAQIFPKIILKDPALTGEARFLSLNMFDVRIICEAKVYLHYANASIEQKIDSGVYSERIKCDPIVFYSRLSGICKDLEKEELFRDLDFLLISRHISGVDWDNWQETMKFANFCNHKPSMNFFGSISSDE